MEDLVNKLDPQTVLTATVNSQNLFSKDKEEEKANIIQRLSIDSNEQEWRDKLKQPEKDTRVRTTVS